MSSQWFDHERLGHPVFSAASTSASSPNHFRPVSHILSPSYEPRLQNNLNSSLTQSSDSRSNPISNASGTAGNGLFLLLQAHEELMKREKAQRASQSDGGNNDHIEVSLKRQAYRWNGKEYTRGGRSRVTINIMMLPDVVLLEIFDFYLDSGDEDSLYMYYDPNVEDKLTAWYTLVRVCRTWRNIVLGSPLRLNLRIYCVPHRTQARKTIVAWPALPIIVMDDCDAIRDKEKWVNNIVAVFEHSDRICLLNLDNIRSQQLEIVLVAMQQSFPVLTRIALHSKDGETAPVVPASFLGGSAPQLQFLILERIPFPGLPKLLLSATHLVCLYLWGIPHSGYISPEMMVTCLSVLTRLEKLSIQFKSPQSLPDRNSRRPPPPTRTLLPVLTRLLFKGVSEYLEDLMARIDAPLLNDLWIAFFHQLILDTPQLTQFISRTPNFKTPDEVHEVHLEFSSGIARVAIRSRFIKLSFGISCRPSDWQVSFLTQMCNLPFLQDLNPVVEHLYIQHIPYSDSEPPRPDDIEGSQWLELLRPFTAVNDLYISKKCELLITPALQELVGERATEALPALRTLFLREKLSSGPVQEAIEQFVTARQLSSHPIAVSYWDGGSEDSDLDEYEEEDGSSYEIDDD